MFKKILVAVDLSPASERLFGVAQSLAKTYGSSLLAVHVLSPEEDGSPSATDFINVGYQPMLNEALVDAYQTQWSDFEERGWRFLQSLEAQAAGNGLVIETYQYMGKPGPKICEVAETWGADLVVIGRRGRRGLTELLLGSVSNYVLHHASCSVFIVHRESELPTFVPNHTEAVSTELESQPLLHQS